MKKTLYYLVMVWAFAACTSKPNKSETDVNAAPAEDFTGQTLSILCWEGYTDVLFAKAFEDKYGVKVKGTYFGTEDEMISKLQTDNGSGTYDIVSPSCDFAGYLIDANLVQPIDTTKISNWNSLNEKLRAMTDVKRNNVSYGLPFTWGPDYIIYNADLVKTPPTSWRDFWRAENKGKVSIPDDIVNIYTAGLSMGLANTDKAALYNMTEAQLLQVKADLLKLQPNVRKYWATAGELNNLFKNKEVTMALGWPLTVSALQAEGMNVKGIIPKEGATGWIDRLMIVKGTKHEALAQLWLDYISTPEAMAKVAEVTSYSVANVTASKFMTPEIQAKSGVGTENEQLAQLNFWLWAKDRKRYNEIWNEVKNGK